MTEAEWLASNDPMGILRHLDIESNEHKTLLLTCACLAIPETALRNSAAGSFDLVTHALQLRGQALAVVALDLDASVLDRAAGAAALLEPGRQFANACFVQGQVEHD